MAIRHDPEGVELAAIREIAPGLSGRRVLEIGCGDGRLTRHYARSAASVLAIDPDRPAAEVCRSAIGDAADVRTMRFEDLVLPDRSVDVVIFSWSL